MARMSFSYLVDNDDLSLDELTEKVMQEDAALSGRKISQSERKANIFDWDQEEESKMIETYSSNAFGLNTSDLEDAHEFLKHSKLDAKDGQDTNEIVGEAWGGDKFSLKDATPAIATSARSGSFGQSGHRLKSNSLITTDAKTGSQLSSVPKKDQPSVPIKHEIEDISDIVAEAPQVSAKAYNEIKQELQKCKILIEGLRNEKWKSAPPDETIQRIILGKPYTMEHYKSLAEKLDLLDYALKYHDGNAITAVVLFLRRTLKPSILATHLNRRPEAFSHLIRYLEATKEWKTLLDLYKQVYRMEDALILQYSYVTKIENPKTKLHEIERLLRDFRNVQGVPDLMAAIEEERNVLEKQIKIEEEDLAAEKQGKNSILRYHPRTASIPFKPLLTTLYYCAMYHFEKPGEAFHPLSLKKDFKLTDKQYEWCVLQARAKLHRWTDITEILTASGWLKRRAEKSQIGFAKILQKYIQLIENLEARLAAATSCSCHEISINTIVAMRDKQKLEQYRENVKFDGNLRQRIQNLLTDHTIKWK